MLAIGFGHRTVFKFLDSLDLDHAQKYGVPNVAQLAGRDFYLDFLGWLKNDAGIVDEGYIHSGYLADLEVRAFLCIFGAGAAELLEFVGNRLFHGLPNIVGWNAADLHGRIHG